MRTVFKRFSPDILEKYTAQCASHPLKHVLSPAQIYLSADPLIHCRMIFEPAPSAADLF